MLFELVEVTKSRNMFNYFRYVSDLQQMNTSPAVSQMSSPGLPGDRAINNMNNNDRSGVMNGQDSNNRVVNNQDNRNGITLNNNDRGNGSILNLNERDRNSMNDASGISLNDRLMQERNRALQERDRAIQERVLQERAIHERAFQERALHERALQERLAQERSAHDRSLHAPLIIPGHVLPHERIEKSVLPGTIASPGPV